MSQITVWLNLERDVVCDACVHREGNTATTRGGCEACRSPGLPSPPAMACGESGPTLTGHQPDLSQALFGSLTELYQTGLLVDMLVV